MRQYERAVDGDSWHDGLLMELIADEAFSSAAHEETASIDAKSVQLEIQ